MSIQIKEQEKSHTDKGVARIFQRGGHTGSYRGYSPDCHLNIVGCLLTKRLTRGGGGVTGTPGPPPWLRPCTEKYFQVKGIILFDFNKLRNKIGEFSKVK